MEGFHSDQYLFWMKRSQIEKSTYWEEKAFAEDAARNLLNGSIWPPRFYSCNFCKREFRSAQALGGHMNIHRRDRAKLKQNLSPQNNIGNNQFFSNFSKIDSFHHPLKKPCSRMISSTILNAREDNFMVETSLSLGLTSMFGQKTSNVMLKSLGEPCEQQSIMSCKRLKTNDKISFPSLVMKQCSNDHHGMDDLDLELRLGKQHKVVN